jgi:hypothetical protein
MVNECLGDEKRGDTRNSEDRRIVDKIIYRRFIKSIYGIGLGRL